MIPSNEDLKNRRWLRIAVIGVAVVLPLFLWILYVNSRTGSVGVREMAGPQNFAPPLSGWIGAWRETYLWDNGTSHYWVNRSAMLISLTVQASFFLFRWRWAERQWRFGIVYALLGLVLGSAVWEGYLGASIRVLLLMTLAFNLTAPHFITWKPLRYCGTKGAELNRVDFYHRMVARRRCA